MTRLSSGAIVRYFKISEVLERKSLLYKTYTDTYY